MKTKQNRSLIYIQSVATEPLRDLDTLIKTKYSKISNKFRLIHWKQINNAIT